MKRNNDKMLLESLVKKYGKTGVRRAVNRLSETFNYDMLENDVKDIVDFELDDLDDSERLETLSSLNNHGHIWNTFIGDVFDIFVEKNGLYDDELDDDMRDAIEDVISKYIIELLDEAHGRSKINENELASIKTNSILTVGADYAGNYGNIIGQPFKGTDKHGCRAAEKMVMNLGLSLGNTFADWAYDMEEDEKNLYWVYFAQIGNNIADCYVFGH